MNESESYWCWSQKFNLLENKGIRNNQQRYVSIQSIIYIKRLNGCSFIYLLTDVRLHWMGIEIQATRSIVRKRDTARKNTYKILKNPSIKLGATTTWHHKITALASSSSSLLPLRRNFEVERQRPWRQHAIEIIWIPFLVKEFRSLAFTSSAICTRLRLVLWLPSPSCYCCVFLLFLFFLLFRIFFSRVLPIVTGSK